MDICETRHFAGIGARAVPYKMPAAGGAYNALYASALAKIADLMMPLRDIYVYGGLLELGFAPGPVPKYIVTCMNYGEFSWPGDISKIGLTIVGPAPRSSFTPSVFESLRNRGNQWRSLFWVQWKLAPKNTLTMSAAEVDEVLGNVFKKAHEQHRKLCIALAKAVSKYLDEYRTNAIIAKRIERQKLFGDTLQGLGSVIMNTVKANCPFPPNLIPSADREEFMTIKGSCE